MRTVLTRNSAAWAFGSTGSIIEHAPNVLRREHDPATGALLGALIEEQRTALNPHAVDFSAWITGSGLERSDAQSVLDDRAASRFDNDGTVSHRAISDVIGTLSGATETFSSTIEAISSDSVVIGIRDLGASAWVGYAEYTLAQDGSASISSTSSSVGTEFSTSVIRSNMTGPNGGRLYCLSARAAATNIGNDRRIYVYVTGTQKNTNAVVLHHAQHEIGPSASSPIVSTGSALTRAPDTLDAPAGNWLPAGRHTWLGAARMSRDPRQPTVLGHPGGRIYADSGRLHLDGPGDLRQPEGDFAAGDYVPFAWTVDLPGAAPDFTIGRDAGDANYWNGHILDINPYPRALRESEIARWLAR